MKWLGTAALALCLPPLLFVPWVFGPISAGVRGISFSFLGESSTSASLASFGVLTAAMVVIAAIGFQLRAPEIAFGAGWGLLIVALWAWLWIAVGDPALLTRVAYGTEWTRASRPFITHYMPGNYRPEPSLDRELSFDTLLDRLQSGWYFLSFGWYFVPIIGLCLIAASARAVDRRYRARVVLAASLVSIIIAALILWNPLIAQYDLAGAVRAEAIDRPDEAIRLYRDAIRRDGWYRQNIKLYVRIGGVEASRGQTFSAEYKAFQAENLAAEDSSYLDSGRLSDAIAILDSIAVSEGELSHAAARREASLLTLYGAHLFNGGAFGGAVDAWRTALTRDPTSWLAAFYLTRGYIVVGRNQEAADLARETIANVADPSMLGDLYNNLADAEMASGNLEPAHEAYYKSYYYNYAANRRALVGITGQ
jgi:tetratricopeptide (TPR) repeat protein